MQGLAGEVGAAGALGPRVSPTSFIVLIIYMHIEVLSAVNGYWMISPCREKEALLEKEVKLGLMVCRDQKVVQVDQDQMGQRYYNYRTTRTKSPPKQILHNVFSQPTSLCFIYFRVTLVQQVQLESLEVQDFRGCQEREAYQELQAQREML